MGNFDFLLRTREQIEHDCGERQRGYEQALEDIEGFNANLDKSWDEPYDFQLRDKLRELLAKHKERT